MYLTGLSAKKMMSYVMTALFVCMVFFLKFSFLAPVAIAADASGEAATARPIAVFDTTNGTFEVELYTDLAPKTAGNFVDLIEKKFYDGTIFHRVIDKFMIQGGDPTGTGRGGPGYTINDEFGPGLEHSEPGILSMANSGPDSGGSQFFVTLVPTPWLDGKHAIFGHVVAGQDVVNAIGKVEVSANDRPVEDVKINTITIKK